MTLSMPVQTSDFSAIANRYDASREIPVALLQACYQRLIELGQATRYVGLDPRDRLPLGDFLLGRGCGRIAVDVTDLRWTRPVRFGEALDQLRDRVFAEFWYLPDDVHHRLLAATADWIERQPEGRATVEVMTPHLSLEVFRKVVTRT